jgi:NAD kinase
MTSIKIVYQKKKKISDTFIINFLRILFCLKVFIGEKLSARVSHLQIRVDNTEKITKTKSSGLCVSTGTGSTSWHTRYIVPFEKKKNT